MTEQVTPAQNAAAFEDRARELGAIQGLIRAQDYDAARKQAEGQSPEFREFVEDGIAARKAQVAAEQRREKPTPRWLRNFTGGASRAEAEPEAEPHGDEETEKVRIHPTDRIAEQEAPPTIEERNKAFEELAEVYYSDPLRYAEEVRRWADLLSKPIAAVERAIKIVRDNRADDGKQSQSTELVALCIDKERVRLWCSPEGDAYVSARVGKHWENHRIESTTFEDWIRYAYGERYRVKIGDAWTPKAPGSGAVSDATNQIKGIARFSGDVRKPAYRVGGDQEVIWIDLGRDDWNAVRVTAQGWQVVAEPEVAFVRNGKMQTLPLPVKGGRIDPLRRLVNVQPEEFPLLIGWQLQALNPVGPYPVASISGQSEMGKTTTSRNLVRVVDPNSADNRGASRRVEDLFIAARNGWTIALDNMSSLTQEWSDAICTVSTGISRGTRAHYTNDEEHVYTVCRPVVFNGIPDNLVEHGDLVSRTIRFDLLPLKQRRGDAELEEEFRRVWPGVFGALLDGLVGALRTAREIQVENPARLLDFERFAEAGCRAMGFGEWEFVDAYAANRRASMAFAVEQSRLGRAVKKFMEKNRDGFVGKPSDLLTALAKVRDTGRTIHGEHWPTTPSQLSTPLRRLIKPLAAIDIEISMNVDRRKEGGGQRDIVLAWSEA